MAPIRRVIPVLLAFFSVFSFSTSYVSAQNTCTCHADGPNTLTDYTASHGNSMKLVNCSPDAAVYMDAALLAMPRAQTSWVVPFINEVWRHVKATYGSCTNERVLAMGNCQRFGAPRPLIAFLHQGGSSTAASNINRFSTTSGYRSTVDVTSNVFATGSSSAIKDVLIHEICHLVESSSQGVAESPSFTIWGDSKWAELCVFDFYNKTGYYADAARVYTQFTASRDNLPSGATNVAWFRDWFYPLWVSQGYSAEFMQCFFGFLNLFYPTVLASGGGNRNYQSSMNLGEFVHFMSAAAETDLSSTAATVFGGAWSQSQFNTAQTNSAQQYDTMYY